MSADPHIFKNKIEKNYQNAIFVCTHDDIRCDGLMEKNEISANKRNGIHVTGFNNFPRIIGNTFIQYNKLAGIRVDNGAHCSILRNSVSKNLGQVITNIRRKIKSIREFWLWKQQVLILKRILCLKI